MMWIVKKTTLCHWFYWSSFTEIASVCQVSLHKIMLTYCAEVDPGEEGLPHITDS